MNSVLLFRTDRVGDFLLTLQLVKVIKSNYSNTRFTVVASEKNYEYIKSFSEIDEVVLLKNNFFSKISLILKLRSYYYHTVIVHDGKNRSRFVSFFLKYKKRIVCPSNLINTQYDTIKKTCNKLELKFNNNSLNFMDQRNHTATIKLKQDFILLHFDEKWIFNLYNKKYVNIEPSIDQFLLFIDKIIYKNKNLVITTGNTKISLLDTIKKKVNPKNVQILENQSLLELESVVFNTKLLISCHGWISHVASARKIKQVDINDKSYSYDKWTSHFRNYNYIYRNTFENLSNEIIKFI